MKKQRKLTPATFSQCVFLSFKYFIQNRLLSFAGACSFSFLFSIIPIFVMIALILVRILHASPKMLASIIGVIPELQEYIDTDYVIQLVQSIDFIHSFEIFIGIFIFWMARRFFASVTDSLQNIFHNRTRRKALLNQIFTFVIELLTISTISAILFFFFSLGTIHMFDFLKDIPAVSFINNFISGISINILPDFLIFAVITILYKSSSGTKPHVLLCAFSALLCTFTFKIFREAMSALLDVASYNLLYGVLSHVIILLMEIFFFFVFFLFFAQFIFTVQFFDELLLGELYLLPKKDRKNIAGKIKRLLFIRPDFLVASGTEIIHLNTGDELFKESCRAKNAYYIAKGEVECIYEDGKRTIRHRGDFIGEVESLLRKKRNYTARALSTADIVVIEAASFRFLVHQNQEASRKVFRKLTAER